MWIDPFPNIKFLAFMKPGVVAILLPELFKTMAGLSAWSIQREQLRALFRRRFHLVKDQRRIKSHIKSFLLYHGVDLPEPFDNPNYYLLRSVPGIGPLTAAAFLAEAGDLRRFSSLKQFASFVGLVPGIYQSGETAKTLGMTPRANQILRSYMVEAAWIAIRRDPVIQAYYRKHLGKNPKSIVIKVARKLLSRLLAVIKTETPYEIGVVA